jgi:hypothetical protein
MSDHGMNDFSDSPQQGSWGHDSNGDVANFGSGALQALDHQYIVPPVASMANSWRKHGDLFKSEGRKTFDDLKSVDWGNTDNKFETLRTTISTGDSQRQEFLTQARRAAGIDPLKWLVGTVIDFLIQSFQPLEDILGLVSGNEARMRVSANMWQEVGNSMPPISEYMNTTVTGELAEWDGDDGQIARARVMEAGLLVDGMGYLAFGMQAILGIMASVAEGIRKLVQALITEGVVHLIEKVAPMMAASIATFGATAPVAIAMAVAKIAGLVYEAYQAIQAAMQIFQTMSEAMALVQEIFTIFQPYLDQMIPVPNIDLGI